MSLSTPAEEIKELSLCKVRSLWTSSLYVVGWHLLQILVEPTSAILQICDQFAAWPPLELPTFRYIYIDMSMTSVQHHMCHFFIVTLLRWGSLQTGQIFSGTIAPKQHFDGLTEAHRPVLGHLGGVLQKNFYYIPCRGT